MQSRIIVVTAHQERTAVLKVAQLLELVVIERGLVEAFATLLLQTQLHLKLLAFGYLESKGTKSAGGVCRS